MTYHFPQGRDCIIVSPADDGTSTLLQEQTVYSDDDKYEVSDSFDIPSGARLKALKQKAEQWQKRGYTLFHFFGKDSRPREFYLIGFVVGSTDHFDS